MDTTQEILDRCAARASEALANGGRRGEARAASLYLAHTGDGVGVRSLARAAGSEPSTVSRAIRRIEARRDDPLFDRMVSGMEAPPVVAIADHAANGSAGLARVLDGAGGGDGASDPRPGGEGLRAAARRCLRRLAEPGAFLISAQSAEMAGVFSAGNQHRRPVAMLPVETAVEFLRQDWIRVTSRGAASVRYRITDAGRSFLRREAAEQGDARPAGGMAEAASPFLAQHRERAERLFAHPETGEPLAIEVNLGESLIGWLSRRKGPDGKPFLTPEEVDAAEQLRSDFEAAQIGPSVAQDWRKFLTPGDRLSGSPRPSGPAEGPAAARDRVGRALAVLGPGLSDVALRTCCFLEGLEGCERRLGWSARSGKVVLKLALQRLVDHYGLAPFRRC